MQLRPIIKATALQLLLTFSAVAAAQVSGSVAVTSDVQYRGQSLSNGGPAIAGSLSYDSPVGLYLGAGATGSAIPHVGIRETSTAAYIGYARQIEPAVAWDVGMDGTHIVKYGYYKYVVDVTELYAGISGRHFSSHVYYSPDYLGQGISTLYFDVSGTLRPGVGQHWRLFSHAGLLIPLDAKPASTKTLHADVRAGAAVEFKRAELQVYWTGSGRSTDYLTRRHQKQSQLVAGLTWFL